MKKQIVTVSLLLSLCASIGFTNALVTATRTFALPAPSCTDLTSTSLVYQSTDKTTRGGVTKLQNALVSLGFLKGPATGYFGSSTLVAVKEFQKKYAISVTGFVGVASRAKLKELTCPGIPATVSLTPSTSSPKTPVVACTMEMRYCPDGSPMKRDFTTCKWLESECSSTVPASVKPTSQVNPVQPKVLACTMEARLCPDGTMMSRKAGSCDWDTTSCANKNTLSPAVVSPMAQ
jgi:hypothetical protein